MDKNSNFQEKLLLLDEPIKKGNYLYVKRVMDIVIANVALVILILPCTVVALIIKYYDPKDSILFKQERIGKNGNIFKMYKFRSMYSNAEEQLEKLLEYNEIDGAMFKIRNDPRVTPVGRIIRKYSIDEIPQLLNVIKGEMSLIGPRPPLIREVLEYTAFDKQRLLVTPGITGLWQVSGRNSLSFKDMVNLDLEYIKNMSMINDIKILMRTVLVVIKSTDAY